MPEEMPFIGLLVSVWAKDPAKGGMLENARLQKLGERSFIVGQLADDGITNDPRVGLTYWFPVDDVVMLMEFRDIKQARAYYVAREAHKEAEGYGKTGDR
jgi:hypothetical protein